MEHLKLFSARLNIPRLIRACEEQHHWRELVFLYVAYDEYDNAALVMMAHSPAAWEHVQFKDVAVKARRGGARWGPGSSSIGGTCGGAEALRLLERTMLNGWGVTSHGGLH